jgi:hypothetical protein
LVSSHADQFHGIVLTVGSLERAKRFLSDNKMLDKTGPNQIMIDPNKAGGLKIAPWGI